MKNKVRKALLVGLCLLAVHSVAVTWVFFYAHNSSDGQAVFAYFPFLTTDAPTVLLAFAMDGRFGFLSSITDWWYARGHQGVNLRSFILISLFGGLHWFVLGYILARAFLWAWQKVRRTSVA